MIMYVKNTCMHASYYTMALHLIYISLAEIYVLLYVFKMPRADALLHNVLT